MNWYFNTYEFNRQDVKRRWFTKHAVTGKLQLPPPIPEEEEIEYPEVATEEDIARIKQLRSHYTIPNTNSVTKKAMPYMDPDFLGFNAYVEKIKAKGSDAKKIQAMIKSAMQGIKL